MANEVWTQGYKINSFLVNPQRKLGIYSLLNLLQDSAWVHATHLGIGYEESLEKQMAWVLSRQKVVMEKWPGWGDEVEVRTWVRPASGPFAIREFEILSGDEIIGLATTSWVLIDLAARTPIRSSLTGFAFRSDYRLPIEPPKIPLRGDLATLAKFQVRNSDLDMNQHVNNTRYVQWILDSVPLEWLSRLRLREYEVNFLAETNSGDVITIQKSPDQEMGREPVWAQFQGLREGDGKIVFAARLKVER